MKINSSQSDVAVVRELGHRIETTRLQKNMTQKEVAELAGVSLISVRRLESGEAAARLTTFVAICRALGLSERFDGFLPLASPQPVDLLKLQGKQRLRARKRKITPSAPWQWGESS